MSDVLIAQALVGIHDGTGRLTGTFTSMTDSFINLKRFNKNVKLKTFIKMLPTQWMDLCIKNSHFGSNKITLSMTQDKKFDAETIICSARFLIDVILYNLDVKCKKVIIYDSFDVACNRYFPDNKFQIPFSFETYYYLANPANRRVFEKYIEYYHKFSSERMDTITFEQPKFYYRRKSKWYIKTGRGSWFENIGKGIFERLYHNVEVYYNINGMKQKDGLYYYLKLLGVDATKNQYPLNVSKEDIENKLIMKEDDIVLDLI